MCVCVVNNHFPSVTPPREMKRHHSLLALCPFHLQLWHACVCGSSPHTDVSGVHSDASRSTWLETMG